MAGKQATCLHMGGQVESTIQTPGLDWGRDNPQLSVASVSSADTVYL